MFHCFHPMVDSLLHRSFQQASLCRRTLKAAGLPNSVRVSAYSGKGLISRSPLSLAPTCMQRPSTARSGPGLDGASAVQLAMVASGNVPGKSLKRQQMVARART